MDFLSLSRQCLVRTYTILHLNLWVVFCVSGIRFYPQESSQISLFFHSQTISKEVTPVILHQIDSCIAHHRPRCHLITFGSYCSVIFILTTLTGKSMSKILYYNIRIKSNISQVFFYFFLRFFRVNPRPYNEWNEEIKYPSKGI